MARPRKNPFASINLKGLAGMTQGDRMALRSGFHALTPGEQEAWIQALSPSEAQQLGETWEIWARDNQLPPSDPDWSIWLLLCGRGFGKTRTIIEWMRGLLLEARINRKPIRIAIVCATNNDAIRTIVKNGIMAYFPESERPEVREQKQTLDFPDGSSAQWFSAEEPDRLRGPQFDYAICDEMAAWTYLEDTWRNLRMMMRLGPKPRIAIATTPKPLPFLRQLSVDPTCRTVFGSTFDNRDNLSPDFFDTTIRDYQGTRYGAQEIYGQILADMEGALFERKWFRYAALDPREFASIAVSLDPATTAKAGSDLTGIIVAAKRFDGTGYVIEDLSGKHSPDEWGRIAVNAYQLYRQICPKVPIRLIAEVNQGGDMVEKILRTVDPSIRYSSVHASKGKAARAEPVAALYQQGRIFHPPMIQTIGGAMRPALGPLEEQLIGYVPGEGKSPDRMDAMVWAFSYLLLGMQPPARGNVGRLGWF